MVFLKRLGLGHIPVVISSLILILSGMGCSSLLYQPLKEQVYNPADFRLKYENIYFPSTDGVKLHAWYFKSKRKEPSQGLILFFHGNAENLSTHFATLAWILEYPYDYMIFDYRGYGDSEGEPSPEGTVKDGMAAIRYASQRAKQVPLVVFAQSLGGAVALKSLIELKHEVPVRFVTIDSSFVSYKAAARGVLSNHWLTWIFQPLTSLVLSDEWAPGEKVSEIGPTLILVIHGKKDQVIGYSLGEELFQLAHDPKEFWTIGDGRHTDVFWGHQNQYRTKFLEMLNHMKKPLESK